MDMYRVTAQWSGFPGAPGYSNFYFSSGFLDGGVLGDEAQVLVERVADAFRGISTMFPAGVQIAVQPEVPVIDSDSGMIQDFNTVDAPAPVGSGINEGFAGPAGAVVTWRTNDLRNGRRIRGRTFLVPLALNGFDDDGTLTSSGRDNVRDFADSMIGSSLDGDLGVWSRPVNGSGGVFASVTGYTVPDLVAVLRSRRD